MPQPEYGDIIGSREYTDIISRHSWITRSDWGIIDELLIHARSHNSYETYRVLDVGCGPGRITMQIEEALGSYFSVDAHYAVAGIDRSETFIADAMTADPTEKITYSHADFLTVESGHQFDAIILQGVFHHVRVHREVWIKKWRSLLAPGGVLIIGDEFIPDFNNEVDRQVKAAGLYGLVIAEGVRSKQDKLVAEEVQNMIDDIASGTAGAGRSSASLVDLIRYEAVNLYGAILQHGAASNAALNLQTYLVQAIMQFASDQEGSDTPSRDKGDYKTSIEALSAELCVSDFKLGAVRLYGPVEYTGGMAVLVFNQ